MGKQKKSKQWPDAYLNGDMVIHITSFLSSVNNEEDANKALSDVYNLRSVCVMFKDVIEENNTIWRVIARLTRRGLVQPTPEMPVSLKHLKEFIRLDAIEYRERTRLAFMAEMLGGGRHLSQSDREAKDYREVVRRSCTNMKYAWGTTKTIYDKRLNQYVRTVKRMDKICGFKSGIKITKKESYRRAKRHSKTKSIIKRRW